MDSQEILELLQYGEHIHLECKKAEPTLPNSVWETYSCRAQKRALDDLYNKHQL